MTTVRTITFGLANTLNLEEKYAERGPQKNSGFIHLWIGILKYR